MKLEDLVGWNSDMTDKQTIDLAYMERNLLALHFAEGWYFDTDNNWEGWKRVLSLAGGNMTFHIPDDFPVGNLKEIKPNWTGCSTFKKWCWVLTVRGVYHVLYEEAVNRLGLKKVTEMEK